MKQYRILKRIVVCVIAFSLILTNAYYVNAKSGVNSRRFLAENDLVDNTNLSISSVASLTIGGEEYTEGMEIDEGDSFSFQFNWTISNTGTTDTFSYLLPDVIHFASTSGNILEGLNPIGTFDVDSNNLLTIKITDEEKLAQNNITGGIILEGELNESKASTDENGNSIINLFNKEYKFKIREIPVNSSLSISKDTVGSYDYLTKTQEYSIILQAIGENNNVVVTDTFGSNMSLGTVNVVDAQGNTVSCTTSTTGQNMQINFDNIPDGSVYTITYKAQFANDVYNTTTNVVTGSSTGDTNKNIVKADSDESP